MKKTKRRALYVLAALFGALFILACLAGFAACSGGDEHDHTWDAGEITTAATCEGTGVRTYTCTECGETKTESIPATGHSWDEGAVTAATCDKDGEILYTCTVCGKTSTEKIDKLSSDGSHTWDEGTVTKEATCTTAGEILYTCEVCDATKTETVDALGHSYETVYIEADEEGNVEAHWALVCSVCGDEQAITDASELTFKVSGEADLQAAVALGGEVVLAKDIDLSSTLEISKTITLDLNGCTLTGTGCDTITVASTGSLTVTDDGGKGVVDAKTDGKAALYNDEGTVVLEGGTFERSQEAGKSESDKGGNSYYTVVNHGTMTINEGVSVLNAGDHSSNVENGYYSGGTEDKSAALTINGGTICGGLYAVKNDSCGTLTVNDGTIGGARGEDDEMPYRALLNWNVATLNGGKFLGGNSGESYESNGSTYYADGSVIYNTASEESFECGKLTIGTEDGKGPEIIYEVSSVDNKTGAGYADAIYLYGGDVTVQGGSIGFDVETGEESYCDCTGVWVIEGTLTVTGGTISGDEAIYVYGGDGSVLITGGTFKGTIENYKNAEDVVIVASDETMLDWAVALDTVTVALGADIAVSDTVTISTTVTLDLNGCTLSCDSTHTITVTETGNLTVIDGSEEKTGTVDVTAASSAALFNEGKVTLEGGTFTRSSEVSEEGGATNSWYTVVNHGTMTIEEGTTIFNAGSGSSNLENGWASGGDETKSATLTINGGTICGGLYAVKNDSCGTLTINGGTIGGARSDDDSEAYSALLNWNVAYIYGGKLVAGNGGYAVYNCASDNTFESGKLTIGKDDGTGPEIVYETNSNSTGVTYAYAVLNNNAKGSITIKGGTITCAAESGAMAIGVYAYDGTTTISGGTITATAMGGGESIGVYVANSTVTISGGTISGDESVFVYGDPDTGTVSITGGTFTGTIEAWQDSSGNNPVTISDNVMSENGFTLSTTHNETYGNYYVYTPNSGTESDGGDGGNTGDTGDTGDNGNDGDDGGNTNPGDENP